MPRDKDLADNLPEVDWSRFEGIAAPAYTQTPDEVFDWIMAWMRQNSDVGGRQGKVWAA